jgi:hypothetical protein
VVPTHSTLLRALVALGLVVADVTVRELPAPAHLVRGAGDDLGELPVADRAADLSALVHLDAGIAGKGAAFDGFGADGEHRRGRRSQSRSTPARCRWPGRSPTGCRCPLTAPGRQQRQRRVRSRSVSATPSCRRRWWTSRVLDIASTYRDAAGLAARIALHDGDATREPWPDGQDVVLLSYLVSAGRGQDRRPGRGARAVHDFLLDDDRPSPPTALWFLQYLAWQPDALSPDADWARLSAGFVPARRQCCPETTKGVLAGRRPRHERGRSRSPPGGDPAGR